MLDHNIFEIPNQTKTSHKPDEKPYKSFRNPLRTPPYSHCLVNLAAGSPSESEGEPPGAHPQAHEWPAGTRDKRAQPNAMKSVSIKELRRMAVSDMMSFLCFRTLSRELRH